MDKNYSCDVENSTFIHYEREEIEERKSELISTAIQSYAETMDSQEALVEVDGTGYDVLLLSAVRRGDFEMAEEYAELIMKTAARAYFEKNTGIFC